jgi:hypothetical protein
VPGVFLHSREEPEGGQPGGEGRRANSRSGHRAASVTGNHFA